jgi:hypothetical protein
MVINMTRPPERVVMFYNQCGTAEQRIKEWKNAIVWTRLSCRRFAANAVRLQLNALAYNLANFLRTLTLPEAVSNWSMTTLRDRLVKIGAKIVRHGRSITFQMAEVMVARDLFKQILDAIGALRPAPPTRCCGVMHDRSGGPPTGAVCPDCGRERGNRVGAANTSPITRRTASLRRRRYCSAPGTGVIVRLRCSDGPGIWEKSVKRTER